jgi:N utilization substance protein B
MTRRNGRILAFQALFAWDASGAEPAGLADFSWRKAGAQDAEDDFAFPRLLFFGAVEHIDEIDVAINRHLAKWDFDRMNKVDLAILRLSVYTLLYQRDMHPSIVIDEAVDIAKAFSLDESYKFINGVLDSVRKEILGEKR